MEELRALNETFIGVAVVKKEDERQDIICFCFFFFFCEAFRLREREISFWLRDVCFCPLIRF